MNGKRATRLRRYITDSSVPPMLRKTVYKAVVRWWASVPEWVRKEAAERMDSQQFAVSARMPVTSQGAKPPRVKRKRFVNPPPPPWARELYQRALSRAGDES